MFAKAFSFWNRLVGTAPNHAPALGFDSPEQTNHNRRVWDRFEVDFPANVQYAESPLGKRFVAQVRDIAQGGCHLHSDHHIPSGQMLSIELPVGIQEIHSVLGCVVRSAPVAQGVWQQGCVFSRELTHDELEMFGAQRVKHEESDNRTWVRFECNVRASYEKVGVAAQRMPAQVINISATGIGMSIDEPLDAGRLLNIELVNLRGDVTRSMLACVVHTTKRQSGEFLAGCNFIRELTDDELRPLL